MHASFYIVFHLADNVAEQEPEPQNYNGYGTVQHCHAAPSLLKKALLNLNAVNFIKRRKKIR
jgi:hypothetical protein